VRLPLTGACVNLAAWPSYTQSRDAISRIQGGRSLMLRREMEKQASKHPTRGIAITVGSKEIGNTSMRPPSAFPVSEGDGRSLVAAPLLRSRTTPFPSRRVETHQATSRRLGIWQLCEATFSLVPNSERLITSLVHRKVARPFTHRSKRSLPEQNILEVSESHRVAIVDL